MWVYWPEAGLASGQGGKLANANGIGAGEGVFLFAATREDAEEAQQSEGVAERVHEAKIQGSKLKTGSLQPRLAPHSRLEIRNSQLAVPLRAGWSPGT
jgi:hypothetical protein